MMVNYKNINKRIGIEPDIENQPTNEDIIENRDPVLEKGIEIQTDKINKTFFMRNQILLILVIYMLNSCSGNKPSSTSEYIKTPEEVGKLVTNDLISRSEFMMYKTEDVHAVHYAEACAGYGAIKLAALLEDKETIHKLTQRYARVIHDNITNTSNHVDANVYGILPLELFIHNKEERFLKQGIELADEQWKNPWPDGLSSQTRYWIDDVYMISCLQVQAYRSTGKMIYLERAALEAHSYIQKLQQPNGLFHHGVNAPFFWGRGNGWVAAGLAELLSVLPENNPHYSSISIGYKKMMKTLVDSQAEDGMWHQLIDNKDSFKETSSTAMFGFAFAVGVKKGILPAEPYRNACIKAWNALTKYIDQDGKVSEVCIGTGQSNDMNYYLTRPRIVGDLHGQAPILWFAYSMLEDYQ